MFRKDFIKTLGMATAGSTLVSLQELAAFASGTGPLMPALFIGHGSPTNVLMQNEFTANLHKIGQSIEKPKAILLVSAHWLTKGTFVATASHPKMIYDFSGFPPEMYQVQYPAPGSPEFAQMVIDTAKNVTILSDHEMGLDHGAWTILKHIYPNADVPVFQLSIDATQAPQFHYNLGKELLTLRKKGVLILSSGNIVHNLRMIQWQKPDPKPYDWAIEFDTVVKNHLEGNKHQALINYPVLGRVATMSIPSNDHYLPMLYTLGLQQSGEKVTFLHEGFEFGSISQRCFLIS